MNCNEQVVRQSLYLDEDVSVLLAKLLRARGFEVVTAREANRLRLSDEEQLTFAAEHQLAMFTHNRVHFERLYSEWLAAGKSHAATSNSTGQRLLRGLRLRPARHAAALPGMRESARRQVTCYNADGDFAMHTTAVARNHITIDENGVARIEGTRMKVLHIAEELMLSGASPAQMLEHWPHLTLSQIHAALAYYYDHKLDMDAQIERERKEFERLRAAQEQDDSPISRKLRDLKSRT